MKRILHLVTVKNIIFKSSYNWFKIDILGLLRPLTAIFVANIANRWTYALVESDYGGRVSQLQEACFHRREPIQGALLMHQWPQAHYVIVLFLGLQHTFVTQINVVFLFWSCGFRCCSRWNKRWRSKISFDKFGLLPILHWETTMGSLEDHLSDYCWSVPLTSGQLVVIPHICHGRHGRRPCKFFLAGVNFYRFNAKNWQFTV